jgi:predicted GNAT family acetyltransferase
MKVTTADFNAAKKQVKTVGVADASLAHRSTNCSMPTSVCRVDWRHGLASCLVRTLTHQPATNGETLRGLFTHTF